MTFPLDLLLPAAAQQESTPPTPGPRHYAIWGMGPAASGPAGYFVTGQVAGAILPQRVREHIQPYMALDLGAVYMDGQGKLWPVI